MENLLTVDELKALKRFDETTSDEGTYDISKRMLTQLVELGVIRHTSRGIYFLTTFGQVVLDKVAMSNKRIEPNTREKLAQEIESQIHKSNNSLFRSGLKIAAGIVRHRLNDDEKAFSAAIEEGNKQGVGSITAARIVAAYIQELSSTSKDSTND